MKGSLQIKLCGFSEEDTINFASNFNINFIGFVFYNKSPRNVDINKIPQITKNIPQNIKKVAVIIDADNITISQIIAKLKPDFLQLHGDESLKRTKEIKELFKIPIIKAFRISSKKDMQQIKAFEEIADYFLFDAKINGQKGGTGKSFNWNILKELNTTKEWFLSGGINVDNFKEALKITNAKMIDLSSALEEVKGVKSKKLIEEFMTQIKEEIN